MLFLYFFFLFSLFFCIFFNFITRNSIKSSHTFLFSLRYSPLSTLTSPLLKRLQSQQHPPDYIRTFMNRLLPIYSIYFPNKLMHLTNTRLIRFEIRRHKGILSHLTLYTTIYLTFICFIWNVLLPTLLLGASGSCIMIFGSIIDGLKNVNKS